jgi:small subunit ribosomal protein S1
LAGADLANLDTLSMPRQATAPATATRERVPRCPPPFPEPVKRPPVAADHEYMVPDDAPILPGRRQKLTPTMEAELDRAMGGLSLDDLMTGGDGGGQEGGLEPESRQSGRVVALRRDEVFVEFGGREQGCLPARSFETPPQPGDTIEVIVQRFNAEDGLYDLTLPGASVELGNWDEVHEGMLVDAQITGHNTGGLECEVNHIRGFIPVSQISLSRVEDLAQFVGQRFACLITDANPARKNLVLSRRAVLEREKEEKKKDFFASLAPGQVHEGTVRKLMDFGAFVELGNGVDGLLHISQLSWGRIKHPSEVVQEGQPIRVRIEKIDHETGRIGLSYREMIENPWSAAAGKYPHNAIVRGKVTRLMEFGAFVELEPGVEGLVHISELSHKRVWRASDVVKEGEEIEVLVLNVDPQAQRMSLSIRGLSKPEPTKKETEEAQEAEAPVAAKKPGRRANQPLKGGLGKSAGGESTGLKW